MIRAMVVTFEPMTESEFDVFLRWVIDDCATDLSRVDDQPLDDAQEKPEHDVNQLLRKGADSKNHTLCNIVSVASENVKSIS